MTSDPAPRPPTDPPIIAPAPRALRWLPVLAVVGCGGLLMMVAFGVVVALTAVWVPHRSLAAGDVPPAYAASQGAPAALSMEGLAVQDALDSGDVERAQQLADEMLARHPDSPEAQLLHATVALQQSIEASGTAEADRILCSALEAGLPIAPGMQAAVAGLWLDEGEPERARVLAERAVALLEPRTAAGGADGAAAEEPDPAELGFALLLRGLARAELGEPSAGIADLERAVTLAPDPESRKEWQAMLDDLRQRAE